MSPQDFIYWLQGFLELSGAKTLSEEQLTMVREHLALVMRKETPELPNGTIKLPRDEFGREVTIQPPTFPYPPPTGIPIVTCSSPDSVMIAQTNPVDDTKPRFIC